MINRALIIGNAYANSSERNGKPDGELVKMIKYKRGEKHPKCDPQSIRKVLAENKGFDFPGHEQVADLMRLMIIPFIIVYFAGIYLTLLPLYLVIILALIPKKTSYPLLGLSIFLSFFIVFLV